MTAALNTSSESLYIDHISPLASLLDIPLIINDERNAALTAKYYPEVKMRYWPDLEFRIQELSKEFDTLIGCDYWHPARKNDFRKLIFCPHGQSDKGYNHPSLAPYALQEHVLIYGDLMRQMLVELKLWNQIPKVSVIGNFRLAYYQKHRDRLLQMAREEIFSKLIKTNRTLLYAPTWKDRDGASTFFDLGEKIAKETPADWNLIIKVHPLLPERDPGLYYRLSLLEEKRPNVVLVDQFPLVYPILECIDAYLGDYSSIGYDVLAFQKPMFFFKQPHLSPARLHCCGEILDSMKNLFSAAKQNVSHFKEAQAELYQKAFAPFGDFKL